MPNLISVILAIGLFATLSMVHVNLHSTNACNMTHMWRYISLLPIEVDENTDTPEYRLYRYMEGFVNEQTLSISSTDIPVLFVPGSGGSAKQVRSIASIMMNKTEMKSAPFRMHFYAIDFNEELSFLSGAILYRQRNFVMKAISVLEKRYSHKIVLIGHSFGGTILHALPADVNFDVSRMHLVITLASPLVKSPLIMDELMVTFYESMKDAWQSRREALRHVVLVSYSGGSKDFQVPDSLAAFPEDHVFHFPSWSVRGVDTEVDHLCILWCNQLIRHSTRILYEYGIAVATDASARSASTSVKNYLQKELNDSQKAADNSLRSSENVVKIGIFDYPWVSRLYTGELENSKKVYELEFTSPYITYMVVLSSDCDVSMRFVYSNFYVRRALVEKQRKAKIMTVGLPYGSKSNTGHIVIEGIPQCNFNLTVRPDVFYAWYLLLISDIGLLIHFTLCALMTLTIAEKLIGRCELSFRGECYINGFIIISVFFCFTYNQWIRECVFTVSIFYILSCFYIISKAVSFLTEKIHSWAPSFMHFWNTILNLIMLALLPVNLCFANSVLAFLVFFQRAAGPYAILLSIFVGTICTALGFSGSTHNDIIHLINVFHKMEAFDIASFFTSLLTRIDFSRILITPLIFHLLSRVLALVRPPQYLASLKDFFIVILLVVPGVVASQVSLSLEACSVIVSLLLTVLSLS
ncbi:hypothetical protein KIN20_027861 [Parelaphostrongylus tenuis]|uniref:GPI inositol-deacylase n=1 Tax=Parelaphostrongylus tenuis TaxID=148309 RepID=A0AAD5R070_PARTN|nr:hypothetical protein KIN20_027861 [Parelaphostrongylus tenuis]